MSHLEALTAYTAAFVAELVKAGVEDVIISPGSRSTPLAMMMAEHPDLKIRIHVDERSAAFFALGIAKASEKPTVLLCTSGTAAANYYPAVIEAKYARVPLIVLTADRPHELRDVGAPQAIDQIHLYGKNVKWFVEMALPENSQDMIRYARTVCTRAVTVASRTPAGPVHLNFPFREPLIPDLERENLFELTERPHGCMNIHTGILSLQAEDAETIATELNNYEKGLIICGPIEDCTLTEKIVELADALQYPIIADPLSQMRSGKHCGEKIVTSYDTFLKNEKAQKLLKPEVIIRFGEMPTSKALLFFLKKHRSIRQFIIDGGGGWRDPSGTGTDMVCCDEKAFCQSITNYLVVKNSTKWLNKWLEIDAVTQRGLLQINQQSSLSEGKLFSLLAKILPNHSTLFVGNSMPIRDLDTFFHFNNKSIRIMGNRGANGIDGIVSTALGAATVSEPLYLIVGDLTFFHDLNGLLAAKLYNINIKIILINNNGGGIFSFLPQSKHAANFEKLFGTPLNLDFQQVVNMYGGKYTYISDWDHFNDAFQQAVEYSGLSVLEIPTNRNENLMEHRTLWNNVSQEISATIAGEIK